MGNAFDGSATFVDIGVFLRRLPWLVLRSDARAKVADAEATERRCIE